MTWVNRLIKLCPINSIAMELVKFDCLEPPIVRDEGFPYRLLSILLWYKRYTISQSLRPRQTAITGLLLERVAHGGNPQDRARPLV